MTEGRRKGCYLKGMNKAGSHHCLLTRQTCDLLAVEDFVEVLSALLYVFWHSSATWGHIWRRWVIELIKGF